MKKLMIMMIALVAMVTGASAANYNLWIAGIQVTDANKSNVTGYGIRYNRYTDGHISYNSSTKTLTLENIDVVTNVYTEEECIKNEIPGLTIQVVGRYNKLSSSFGTAIKSVPDLTIQGEGVLELKGETYGIFITAGEGNLRIQGNVRLVAVGQNNSAITKADKLGDITIKDSKTMVLATSYGDKAVKMFDDMWTIDVTINRPSGYVYNSLGLGDVGTPFVVGNRQWINSIGHNDSKMLDAIRAFDTDGNGYLERDENFYAERFYDNGDISDFYGLYALYDLKEFDSRFTKATYVGFYNQSLIENIVCAAGNVSQISVENCPWLSYLQCYASPIASVDLSNNSRLESVNLSANQLVSIDLPDNFTEKDVYLSVERNWLKGEAMDNLIADLPMNSGDKNWNITVLTTVESEIYGDEQNEVTASQLAALKSKKWKPLMSCKEKGEYVSKEYTGNKEYDLWINGGTKVTDENASDIMGDGGGMSYSPTTKTLSLMNDYEFNTNGIQSYIDGLTIKVVDASTLDCRSDAIDLYANTTIMGNSPLTIKSKYGLGIYSADGKNVTIDNANIDFSTPNAPCILGATTNGTQKLIVKQSNIHGKCNDLTVVVSGYSNGIILDGCGITQPEGGYVKDGDIVDKDGNWATEFTISKASTFYPVYIAGRQLNNLNATDYLGDGSVSYDAETKTLTLNNCQRQQSNNAPFIEFKESGIKLNVVGENILFSTANVGIRVGYEMQIIGNGSLDVVSGNDDAIYLFWGILYVDDAVTLTADGEKHGIAGFNSEYGNAGILNVMSKNATVAAKGVEGSIRYLSELTLADGVGITKPEGAVYDATSGDVLLNGVVVTDEVVIEAASNMYELVLHDGDTFKAGENHLEMLCSVLEANGLISWNSNATTHTVVYSNNNGKPLFRRERYDGKDKEAYFIAEGVEESDAIVFDYSDNLEEVLDCIENYEGFDDWEKIVVSNYAKQMTGITLRFDIPDPWPTVDVVINVENGMTVNDLNLKQYAGLMAMWKYFGALQLTEEGDNYVYKSNDGKTLCYISKTTGEVTLAEGVTAADKVYRRLLHKDREAMRGKYGLYTDGSGFRFDNTLEDCRSITLTVNNGSATGINTITSEALLEPTYNLSGQRVGDDYRGIIIKDGRKVVVK